MQQLMIVHSLNQKISIQYFWHFLVQNNLSCHGQSKGVNVDSDQQAADGMLWGIEWGDAQWALATTDADCCCCCRAGQRVGWWTDIMEKIEIRASAFGQMQHVCRKFYRPKTNFELFSIILNQIYYNSIMEKSVPSSECQKLTF